MPKKSCFRTCVTPKRNHEICLPARMCLFIWSRFKTSDTNNCCPLAKLRFTWDFTQLSERAVWNIIFQETTSSDRSVTAPRRLLLLLPRCRSQRHSTTAAEITESARRYWSDSNNYTLESHITSRPILPNPYNNGGMPSIAVQNRDITVLRELVQRV
jgi:hypothetical protein